VTLDEFLREDPGDGLYVVDVLGVVSEEFAFLLEEMNECVSGGEFFSRR
jgi:hypothetical protein